MQAHVAKCRVGACSLSCILPHVPIGRTPGMNHLTASGLLRSQFSGIRQMMNGMAELLQNLYISAANSYFLFEKEMVLLKQKRFGMEEMMERYRDRGISVE